MPFPTFLDANVLIPINLTDVLLRLADADTYRPVWSAHALDEVQRNLPSGTAAMTPDKARCRIEAMRHHFRDAEVTGYASLIPAMTHHENDRHVLAAAVRADAALIVTANISDCPDSAPRRYDITAVTPDAFLLDQLDVYPGQTVQCLQEIIADRQRPPETLPSFLDQLAKTVPQFCQQLGEHLP